MKILILCMLTLLIGIVAKAQSASASLNITLTDIQSVKFDATSLDQVTESTPENIQSGNLQVLSKSTAQIKKIQSKTSEYEKLYKELSSNKLSTTALYTNTALIPVNTRSAQSSRSDVSHIIYQIDPR